MNHFDELLSGSDLHARGIQHDRRRGGSDGRSREDDSGRIEREARNRRTPAGVGPRGCWLVGSRGVTCRDSREWVECAPRRRVARPGRRPSCPYPANGLYRRRAHDWDPGFRMRGSLSRIKHAGAARSPSLFPTRRLASPLSVFLTQQPAGARLLLLTRGVAERVLPTLSTCPYLSALPTCLPYLPVPLSVPLWPYLRKDVHVINNYPCDVIRHCRERIRRFLT